MNDTTFMVGDLVRYMPESRSLSKLCSLMHLEPPGPRFALAGEVVARADLPDHVGAALEAREYIWVYPLNNPGQSMLLEPTCIELVQRVVQ